MCGTSSPGPQRGTRAKPGIARQRRRRCQLGTTLVGVRGAGRNAAERGRALRLRSRRGGAHRGRRRSPRRHGAQIAPAFERTSFARSNRWPTAGRSVSRIAHRRVVRRGVRACIREPSRNPRASLQAHRPRREPTNPGMTLRTADRAGDRIRRLFPNVRSQARRIVCRNKGAATPHDGWLCHASFPSIPHPAQYGRLPPPIAYTSWMPRAKERTRTAQPAAPS